MVSAMKTKPDESNLWKAFAVKPDISLAVNEVAKQEKVGRKVYDYTKKTNIV